MSKFVVTLDAGTTSERAILFDHSAQIQDVSQKEFKQIYPKSGWVEHDPLEIWNVQKEVLLELLGQHPDKEIAALGITNQRETTIIWEKATGKPIHNAIVWQDRRTADYCEDLKKSGYESTIQYKTGLLIDAYFSGSKIRWILDKTGSQERAEKGELAFGTVDSWLVWQLTGGKVHVTDVTNASRTMLMNIHSLEWDKELLDIFNIPLAMLPEIKSSSEVYGHTEEHIFGAAIPIAGIAGDQQSALFGQMCTEPGMVKNTYGTGCFVVLNTGEKVVKSRHSLLSTVAWKVDGKVNYALEGSIFIGGAIVQWLRDNIHLIEHAAESEALAKTVDDNGGVVFVPGFVGLGAPHWDQYSTGTLIGLSRGTESGHIARAALEAIALQTMDVLDTMRRDSGIEIDQLKVDGGASANDFLMQIQSDIAGTTIIRPKIIETTAMGAAFLAGLAVGFWTNTAEIEKYWSVDREFTPSGDDLSGIKKNWHKAIERSKGWNLE